MLTLLGNPPPCCSRIMGSLIISDGCFPTTNPTHTSHVNSPSQGFLRFSLPPLWAPPTLDCPTLVLLPPSLAYRLPNYFYYYLFIYLFILLPIYVEIIAFLPSHCGGSFPSQWSSSPPHCWAPPLLTVGLLPFSLLGSSPSHCWAAPLLTVGLLPFSLSHWGSSPSHCLVGAPPSLSMGALSHRTHSSEGLLPVFLWGVISLLLQALFPSRSFGSPSPWGSSPSRSLKCGASPHLCGAPHLSVGLFTVSPWGLI